MSQTKSDLFSRAAPCLVTGDFDSICPKVKDYYEKKVPNCEVICTPDQNLTDFAKSLLQIAEKIPNEEQLEAVYAYTEYGGRLDQIFGVFHALFHATQIEGLPPVFLISPNSIDWVLAPGKHIIDLTSEPNSDLKELEKSHCGIIPLGEPCNNVITSGLKWNLSRGQTLSFGTSISTGNKFISNIVEIKNESPLIWTMEIQKT